MHLIEIGLDANGEFRLKEEVGMPLINRRRGGSENEGQAVPFPQDIIRLVA